MAQRHLTIREAKNEIRQLENELDVYLTKRNINFLRTQPRAMQIKDIVVDSSHMNVDSFLNYVERDEEYDTKIYGILAAIYTWKAYIAKEIQRLSEYDEVGYIRYLKEEEKRSWREIDHILHHGEDYSRLKYNRYLKKNSVSIANDTF